MDNKYSPLKGLTNHAIKISKVVGKREEDFYTRSAQLRAYNCALTHLYLLSEKIERDSQK